MISANEPLSAPKQLALAYAKGEIRMVLTLLLTLDVRFASIIRDGREPLIGQMRLAWWNDVITKPAVLRPKGEPLLQQLAVLEQLGFEEALQTAMMKLVAAWDLLLAHETWSQSILLEHANYRSQAVFSAYENMLGQGEGATNSGVKWALHDLATLGISGDGRTAAITSAIQSLAQTKPPRRLKPLSVLAKAAQQEYQGDRLGGLRLLWHGLTGR